MSGGFCPGGFCPGVYVRGVFVLGGFVLEPRDTCDWSMYSNILKGFFSSEIELQDIVKKMRSLDNIKTTAATIRKSLLD